MLGNWWKIDFYYFLCFLLVYNLRLKIVYSLFFIGIILFYLGCFIKWYDDWWSLKYFDFDDFVMIFRVDFIGRKWLYCDMEELMENLSYCGLLFVGSFGFGKIVFVLNLFCFRSVSLFIYDRIVGYYFCMYLDKGI